MYPFGTPEKSESELSGESESVTQEKIGTGASDEVSGSSEESEDGPPSTSDIPAPPLEETDYELEIAAKRAAEEEAVERAARKAVYDKCMQIGRERAALMVAAATEGAVVSRSRLEERQSQFDKNYTTTCIDWDRKPLATTALRTTWDKATDPQARYTNTPMPGCGGIYSWENVRHKGDPERGTETEPLQNSDAYFYQYKSASGSTASLPPLKFVRREAALSGDGHMVYAHLMDLNLAQTGVYAVPPGLRKAGTDDFYALLGAANGIAPTYLVVDHGRELGIAGIAGIDIDKLMALTYVFEPIEPSTRSASMSSSSSSTSTSTSSFTSTSSPSSSSSSSSGWTSSSS